MLNVFVCEDNDSQRKIITQCICDYIAMENLAMTLALSTGNPEELIAYIEQRNIAGLYFLDVDLKHTVNGIMLAQTIRKYDPRGFIVFVTAHDEALPMTFKYKVEAMDYIIKDDMDGIKPQIVLCIKDAHIKYNSRFNELHENLVFKMSGQKVVSMPFAKIIYIETSPLVPRKVILHVQDGLFDFYGKLDELQKQLDARFFRCHKSFIVNTQAIERVDMKDFVVYMRGGYSCLIATRKIRALVRLIKI